MNAAASLLPSTPQGEESAFVGDPVRLGTPDTAPSRVAPMVSAELLQRLGGSFGLQVEEIAHAARPREPALSHNEM